MTDNKGSSDSDTPGLRQAGALLRKHRLQQGFTIEEIAQATRIQRSHLRAIERGDGSELPSGPFAKGFVVSYGRHLGVNSSELENLLAKTSEEPPPTVVSDSDGATSSNAPPAVGRNRRMLPILGLVGVAVVAVSVALALRGGDPPVVEPAEESIALAPVVAEGGPRADSERIVRAASVEGEDGQSYIVFTDTEREETPHLVEVKATFRSYLWVAAEMGGEPMFEGVLEPGEDKSFQSEEELWVVFGNAGGVAVKYDGESITDLGPDGDRRGFAFRGP